MRQRAVVGSLLVVSAMLPGAPARAGILVTNSGADYRVTVFGNGANGNVAPLRKIEGDATALVQPGQIFVDVARDELYVANQFDNAIAVYPLGATGDQPPLRQLKGAATLLDRPTGVVVDLVHDELIVVSFDSGHDGSITVYPRTANGNVAPLRRVAGAATGLVWAVNAAFDPVANEIFVSCQGSNEVAAGVRVFARTANGNAAPLRTISGNATFLSTPYGILLDRPRNELYVSDRDGWISVFPRMASGNVAPVRRIVGGASTLLETLGLALLGNSEIVAANGGLGGNDDSDDAVLVFPRTATGNVAPSRRINGPATEVTGPVGVAVASPRLALVGGRFGVQAVFRTVGGTVGDGIPVALTTDTGYFWFFQAPNVEVVVKVLDGCGINGRFWVFAGGLTDTNVDLIVTDHATGQVRYYANPQKTAFQPIQDTDAFATCGTPASIAGRALAATPTPALDALAHAGGDLARAADESFAAERSAIGDSLYLNNERFRVRAQWETRTGATGVGTPVALTSDTGYFWFFQSTNVEVVVKVLDGCGTNGRYWVFAGGLTDVEVELEVEDTANGSTAKVYMNPQRTPFQPIQDTAAFATCP